MSDIMSTAPTTLERPAPPTKPPAPEPRPVADLDRELFDLASKITSGLGAIKNATRDIVQRAIAVGEYLIEAKAKVPHGQWLRWLKDNCKLEERTIQRYIKLAEGRATLLLKSDTLSDLTMTAALQLIDKPGADREDDNTSASKGTPSTKTPTPLNMKNTYVTVEKKLIAKLEKMPTEDAVTSAQHTIDELVKMVRAKNGGKNILKLSA